MPAVCNAPRDKFQVEYKIDLVQEVRLPTVKGDIAQLTSSSLRFNKSGNQLVKQQTVGGALFLFLQP